MSVWGRPGRSSACSGIMFHQTRSETHLSASPWRQQRPGGGTASSVSDMSTFSPQLQVSQGPRGTGTLPGAGSFVSALGGSPTWFQSAVNFLKHKQAPPRRRPPSPPRQTQEFSPGPDFGRSVPEEPLTLFSVRTIIGGVDQRTHE